MGMSTEYFILAVWVTVVLTRSYVFDSVRYRIKKVSSKAGYLVECALCLGFYVGIIIYLIEKDFGGLSLFFAAKVSLASYLLVLWVDHKNTSVELNQKRIEKD